MRQEEVRPAFVLPRPWAMPLRSGPRLGIDRQESAVYQPPHFREDRLDIQHDLIRAQPFGLLISATDQDLLADPMPFFLDTSGGGGPDALGQLHAHLARANPHWQHLDGRPVLVVFQGAQAYVTPSWYETKRQSGRVVPTWDYVMVQVRGTARVIEDPAWLRGQIEALTDAREEARDEPWAVSDAPAAYVDAQLRGIVGLEIAITEIEAKCKLSQNKPGHDRRGVADGLAQEGHAALADAVRRYGDLEAP